LISGFPVGTQVIGSSYLGFGHNLRGFNPSSGPTMGGSGGSFQPQPLEVGPNPQMQGVNNVPFQ